MLVTVPGILNRSQCQKPTPVGASESNAVTAKLRVLDGAPVHARSGERLLPAQPLKASAVGIVAPLANALLVTVSFATVPVPGARSVTVGVAAAAGAADSGILLHTAALATATAARIGNKERINTTSVCTVPKKERRRLSLRPRPYVPHVLSGRRIIMDAAVLTDAAAANVRAVSRLLLRSVFCRCAIPTVGGQIESLVDKSLVLAQPDGDELRYHRYVRRHLSSFRRL
jgi:hypothetical protein